ncbi:DnaJ domain-containing protein [Cynara cardunculus var. scolymus]|uniref:DnaJ domain-containing protein n=1 Tax=Cynara cardunculus var. scolymus TaxID=59895 RepID=A0A103XUS6_CYNCS|nr:DnaJ domain-containing protein [Cynara cardunculus var. scolymus]
MLHSIVFSLTRSCWGCGSKFEGLLPDYVQKGTKAYIEEFKANYRGSKSERTDLIDLYKKYKGHMNSRMPKKKFLQLQNVISILGDEEKQALYDQTGCVDDALVRNPKSYYTKTNFSSSNQGGVIDETNQASPIERDNEVGSIEGHEQSSPQELDHNEGGIGLHETTSNMHNTMQSEASQ